MRSNTGGAFIHSGLGGCLGGVFNTPRGFAPGYDPAALQAAPASIHSGPGARLGGVCNTPLHRYGHSPRWGVYPAKFAGVRRRPGLTPKHLNGAQPQQLNTYRTTTFSVSGPTLMM